MAKGHKDKVAVITGGPLTNDRDPLKDDPAPTSASIFLPQYPNTQLKMPTARDATSAMVASEIMDSAIISSLALTVSGNVSAGENAVAFVNAKNR